MKHLNIKTMIGFRNSSEVKLATKISFAWYLKNYVATTRLLQKLSPLSKCAVFCNLRIIKRFVIQIKTNIAKYLNLLKTALFIVTFFFFFSEKRFVS